MTADLWTELYLWVKYEPIWALNLGLALVLLGYLVQTAREVVTRK